MSRPGFNCTLRVHGKIENGQTVEGVACNAQKERELVVWCESPRFLN
jgi:hypothetical protein